MKKYIEQAHERLLKARRIYTTISSLPFEKLYNEATPQERAHLEEILTNADEDSLNQWLQKYTPAALEEMSYKQLLHRAKSLRVPNYSRMIKEELLFHLKGFKDEKR